MPNRYPLTTDNSDIYFNQGSGEQSLSVDSLITTDATPTSSSTNPVQSGGVYTALQSKVDTSSFNFLGLTDTPNSYTAGSILFTSGSAVTQDNANLFWDDTNKRLGIGTNSPDEKLVVDGKIKITAPTSSGIYKTIIQTNYDYNNPFQITTNNIAGAVLNVNYDGSSHYVGINNEKLVININGNIGANKITPTAKIHIKGSTSDNTAYGLKVDDSSDAKNFYVRNDGQVEFKNYVFPTADGTSGQVLKTNGSGALTWQNDAGASATVFESVSSDTLIREATNTNQYNRDFIIGSPQLADDGNTAHDSRVWFDKSKRAFRAGLVEGTEWDDANVGNYSFACGYNTKASYNGSFAEGYWCDSIGNYGSHAEGNYTSASGMEGAHAEGTYTIASGHYGSHAEGDSSEASGYSSHAEGGTSLASGDYSHAEGSSTASGLCSHSEGNYTVASGNSAHAEGYYSNAYLYGMSSHAYNRFAADGDSQNSVVQVMRATTTNTTTELTIGGAAPAATTRVILPANRTWIFKVTVGARQTAGSAGTVGDSKGFKIEGGIKRDGANNTVLIGTPTVSTIVADTGASAWTVAAVADDTNESLQINVTGETNKTIHWSAKIELIEIG